MGDSSNIRKKNPTPTLSKSGWERGAGVLLRCPVCALPTVRLRCTPTAATRFVKAQATMLHFPQAEMHPSAAPKVDGDIALPYHERETQKTEPLSVGVAAYEKLLAAAPFVESFYLKVRVDHIGEGQPDSGIYEIWR